MIPPRFAPALSALILSGFMSCLVSGIATLRAAGWVDGLAVLWAGAWLSAWLVAFPAVLVVAPLTQRVVRRVQGERGPDGAPGAHDRANR